MHEGLDGGEAGLVGDPGRLHATRARDGLDGKRIDGRREVRPVERIDELPLRLRPIAELVAPHEADMLALPGEYGALASCVYLPCDGITPDGSGAGVTADADPTASTATRTIAVTAPSSTFLKLLKSCSSPV